jgi:hypothetical protein
MDVENPEAIKGIKDLLIRADAVIARFWGVMIAQLALDFCSIKYKMKNISAERSEGVPKDAITIEQTGCACQIFPRQSRG